MVDLHRGGSQGAGRAVMACNVVLLLAMPTAASANVGPGWLVGGEVFLVLGIWPLAAIEALALAWRYRLRFGPLYVCALGGNFASWIVGLVTAGLLGTLLQKWLSPRWLFYHVPEVTVGVVVLAFLLSGLIEWPVYRPAFSKAERPWRASLRGSFVAQAASYLLLVVPLLWWQWAWFYSLYHTARLDASLSFMRGTRGWVYYVRTDDWSVRRVRLDGTGDERVRAVPAPLRADAYAREPRLAVLPGARGSVKDVVISSGSQFDPLMTVPADRIAPYPREPVGTSSMVWAAADLRAESERIWEVRTGFWGGDGLSATRTDVRGRDIRWGLDTPLVLWMPNCPTVLPGNRVVWQFEPNILAGSLPGRRVGWLAHGQGPVVVLEE